MLNLWKRHSTDCRHVKRTFKRCGCVVWVSGSLHGQKMRKSLGIRNWDAAQRVVRDWEAKMASSVSVSEAFNRFMADCAARSLGVETMKKYLLLRREMTTRFGHQPMNSVTVGELSQYREAWKLSPVSAGKKIERMRSFFKFGVDRKWTDENPAKLLKTPRAPFVPTMPFSGEDIEKIRNALEKYPDKPRGRRMQVRAFILLMMHSGLRIRDCVCITQDKIAEGKLLLYTAKTGQPVWVPLPFEVTEAMETMPFRPFWSGVGLPKSAVADWQRTIGRLFKITGVVGHAHMFRATLAVRLLNKGASLEDVAALLGNSVKVCERHYAPWVKVRQDRLEEAVKRTFGPA
jgi:integrase/recombinase XerD